MFCLECSLLNLCQCCIHQAFDAVAVNSMSWNCSVQWLCNTVMFEVVLRNGCRDAEQYSQAETMKGLLVLRVNGPVCFANVEYIKEWLARREVCCCNALHCSLTVLRQVPNLEYFLLPQQKYHPLPPNISVSPPLPPPPPPIHLLTHQSLSCSLASPLSFHCSLLTSLSVLICTVH